MMIGWARQTPRYAVGVLLGSLCIIEFLSLDLVRPAAQLQLVFGPSHIFAEVNQLLIGDMVQISAMHSYSSISRNEADI